MIKVPLTRGFVALIDDEDGPLVLARKWHAVTTARGYPYACSYERGVHTIRMHRLIAAAPPHLVVDHINRNTLDNRRSNLRVCTQRENLQNSIQPVNRTRKKSRFKGVSPSGQKWRVDFTANSKTRYVGTYETEEEAARAYDALAREKFGEYARLNFPTTHKEMG